MKTVLVLDDEHHVRLIVSAKSQKKGYHVITAADGDEAIELAKQNHLDLVITDHQMPGVSGLDFAQLLFAYAPHSSVPVIMITARAFEIDKEDLAATNIRHLEGKPFSVSAILTQVEKLIGPGAPAQAVV